MAIVGKVLLRSVYRPVVLEVQAGSCFWRKSSLNNVFRGCDNTVFYENYFA